MTVVVLTWNQRDYTLACLKSLRKLNHAELKVIVVDNASNDGTAEAIRSTDCSVTVIENSENLGYVGGNNVGIKQALQYDTDYILLLNNDTELDPMMIDELLTVMEADQNVGVTGPKMLYFDEPSTVWCAGNHINWHTGECIRLQADEADDALDQVPRDVDYITGCAICLRRDVVEEIGLLDSRFFIYYEETDWCIRAKRAGWRTVYVPRARLWHKVSAAMGATSPATDYYMTRNALLFLAKNRHGPGQLWSLTWSVARTMRIVAAYSVKNRSRERLRSRNARLLGLRDALLQRWGKMGLDVANLCYET